MSLVLDHPSLPETVRRVLRRGILNNDIPSGARLIEANLAAEHGVSRATIRAAMRELASEGLVEITPRRHSVVTRMSAQDAEDVCFARYVLETGVARSLSAKVRQSLDTPLLAVLDEMDAAALTTDLEALVEADVRFHGLVMQASGRRRAAELWAGLNGQMGALIRGSIDRQHLGLHLVRARHEPVHEAVVHGSPKQVDRALYAHYISDSGLDGRAGPDTSVGS